MERFFIKLTKTALGFLVLMAFFCGVDVLGNYFGMPLTEAVGKTWFSAVFVILFVFEFLSIPIFIVAGIGGMLLAIKYGRKIFICGFITALSAVLNFFIMLYSGMLTA